MDSIIGPGSGFPFTSLEGETLKRSLQRIFLFCCGWGIGGSIDSEC